MKLTATAILLVFILFLGWLQVTEISPAQKQYALILKSVEAFNAYRLENPDEKINLRGADLSGRNLIGINLSGADLRHIDLSRTVLLNADLSGADLRDGSLRGALLALPPCGEQAQPLRNDTAREDESIQLKNFTTQSAKQAMADVNKMIEELRARERTRKGRLMAGYFHDDFTQKIEEGEIVKQKEIMPRLRPANPSDYAAWLRGYIEHGGGEPTHAYDYNMPANFYVAVSDFSMVPLYGSQSINVIVPAGIKFLGGRLGHSNVYLMESYSKHGMWAPMYANIRLKDKD